MSRPGITCLLTALLASALSACSTEHAAPELVQRAPARRPLPAAFAAFAADNQQAKLVALDGAAFDTVGAAVAVSGDIAVIGAPRADSPGADAGAAYVFVRSGAGWTLEATLTAPDGTSNDNFGAAVAVSGATAVVGAQFHDAGASDAGAAYVFVRTGTTWTQQAKLVAADGSPDHQLGLSVALSADTAVVGSVNDSERGTHAGAAYVFVRDGTTWAQQAKLCAADGAEFDQLGISVAVEADTVVVGAYGDDDNGRSSGSAYVFLRSGTSWAQQAKLLATDGADIDELGISVGVSGDTALAGAVFSGDRGAAYVFTRTGASWAQQAKLTATDATGGDNFGAAVALGHDTAVVGAPGDGDQGAASGSFYVFRRSGASWTQDAKHVAAGGAPVDLFGAAVALSGTTAVIGAPGDDQQASSAGAAYVFAPTTTTGQACAGDAACATGLCVDGVCCDTACGGGDPGDCEACSVASGAAVDGTCAPRVVGTVCRAAAGGCDAAETCTGSSAACPADGFAGAGTVCRAAAGGCDAAETCTGSSAACPADGFAGAGTVCRTAAGACDTAETCTGSSAACPADGFAGAGTVCRTAAGGCDAAETCTGSSAACPADGLIGAGTVCRPAASSCDLAESCTGAAGACPANRFKPDLSLCHGLLGLPGVCLAGTCVL